MRDLSLDAFLELSSNVLGAPPSLLLRRMLDPDRTIQALAAGGGEPNADPKRDAARRATTLFEQIVKLQPSLVGRTGDLAYAAARQLAANLGFELHLPRAAELADSVYADNITHQDLQKRIELALVTAVTAPTPYRVSLLGLHAAISHAVSNPTASLRPITEQLAQLLQDKLERTGCKVDRPQPCSHVNRRGRRDHNTGPTANTDELFRRSYIRVTSRDILFSIDDPQGGGSVVERQWAKELGMPVFNLQLHDAIHPHDDGDGWNLTYSFAAGDSLDELTSSVMAAAHRYSWVLHDYHQQRLAVERKNEQVLAHLKAAWLALDLGQRAQIVSRARIAEQRIDAYLSSGVAWELVSGREQSALQVHLLLPPQPSGAVYHLRDTEVENIAHAADQLGLSHLDTLVATTMIARRMTMRSTRFDLSSPGLAKAAVLAVLRPQGD